MNREDFREVLGAIGELCNCLCIHRFDLWDAVGCIDWMLARSISVLTGGGMSGFLMLLFPNPYH